MKPCSMDPLTGWYRDGCCATDDEDIGEHTVCVRVTQAFLEYSKQRGNDLSTPKPQFGFPGLKEGDRWCVCAGRWLEAREDGVAPAIVLESTHESLLDHVPLGELLRYASDHQVM